MTSFIVSVDSTLGSGIAPSPSSQLAAQSVQKVEKGRPISIKEDKFLFIATSSKSRFSCLVYQENIQRKSELFLLTALFV